MNIASVSWTDHLVFGEDDGQLDTADKVRRRFGSWRDELRAGALHWRLARSRIPGRFFAGRGYHHPSQAAACALQWDDLALVPELAHVAGLEAWLYVSLFDEGWPLPPARVRAVSYHNQMHGQHIAWQSELTRVHPEWIVVDRRGRTRQWGVVSCAYPAARRALIDRWMTLIVPTRFDGLFVCLRSQSKPADDADQFGYNAPVCADFWARYGVDITATDFDRQAWRDLSGEYLTQLLTELRDALANHGRQLGVGIARGDVLGPPLGNSTIHWRNWIRRALVDQLVIDQNSSRCPSMWHELWPMHRGTGYVQNYLDGSGLPPRVEHVRQVYGQSVAATATRLYVARQWHERSAEAERELSAIPGVAGLVFSTFRHDNPRAIARGQWHAGVGRSASRGTGPGGPSESPSDRPPTASRSNRGPTR